MVKRSELRRETQAAIFDAACELFDAHGYADTTVEEICQAAGVGRATFFRHFETKAGLFREFNRRTAELADARIDALPASSTADDRLHSLADTIHDRWIDASSGMRDLFRDSVTVGDPNGDRLYPELRDLLRKIVADGRASGELALLLPTSLSAHLVLMHLAASTSWWFNHSDDDLRDLLHRSINQCLKGIEDTATPARRKRSA